MGEVQSTYGSGTYSDKEKVALLGLWSVPGVGTKTLEELRSWAGGQLSALLDVPVSEFANGAQIPSLRVPVRQRLCALPSLEAAAEAVMRQSREARMRVHFLGDPGYPRRLAEIEDAPPVIFAWGQLGPSRRRVAMVGSRATEQAVLHRARKFAAELASAGVGVVSGMAWGVDQHSHAGAVSAGGETWGFVGSALDQLDPIPAGQVPAILRAGGVVMSEYPPGVRADKTTFPRRNRLITAASDAVLVVRAAGSSGALHTAAAALRQGRPLFAIPGDPDHKTAAGCNWLIRKGHAVACTSPDELLSVVGVNRGTPSAPVAPAAEVVEALTEAARTLYDRMPRAPADLETLGESVGLSAAALTAALVELELQGLVQQYPGKVFEKI